MFSISGMIAPSYLATVTAVAGIDKSVLVLNSVPSATSTSLSF
jgi:hypothetical protein